MRKQGKCKCMWHTSAQAQRMSFKFRTTDNSTFKSRLSLRTVTSNLSQFMMFTWTGKSLHVCADMIELLDWLKISAVTVPIQYTLNQYYITKLSSQTLYYFQQRKLRIVFISSHLWRDQNSAGSTTLAVKSRSSWNVILDTGYGLHIFRPEKDEEIRGKLAVCSIM